MRQASLLSGLLCRFALVDRKPAATGSAASGDSCRIGRRHPVAHALTRPGRSGSARDVRCSVCLHRASLRQPGNDRESRPAVGRPWSSGPLALCGDGESAAICPWHRAAGRRTEHSSRRHVYAACADRLGLHSRRRTLAAACCLGRVGRHRSRAGHDAHGRADANRRRVPRCHPFELPPFALRGRGRRQALATDHGRPSGDLR